MAISYYTKTIELEMTRRCGGDCKHCMRGNVQNIDMNTKVIKSIFENQDHKLTSAFEIFLTGGEPFLNKEGVLTLFEYILTHSIPVKQIEAITSGLICDKEILSYSKKLLEHGIAVDFEVHFDQFHPPIPLVNKKCFESLDFFSFYKKRLRKGDIIQIGKAQENHIGSKLFAYLTIQRFKEEVFDSLEVYMDQAHEIFIPGIYVTADGKFGSLCGDASWEMIDKKYHFDITKDSLFTNCRFDPDKSKTEIREEFLPFLLKLPPFKEDYLLAQKNGYLSIFLHSLDEERIREYFVNNSITRKRNLHF